MQLCEYVFAIGLPLYVPIAQQETLLSERGRAMLRVCIASIQHVERSLLLLVVSASDIPLRTVVSVVISRMIIEWLIGILKVSLSI